MIKLICDSSCGITEDFAKENDIKIVSLKTTLDGITKKEGFEKDWDDFYEQVKVSKDFPKTSQPSPEEYEDAINEILQKDENNEVLIITLSSSLSGTYNAARLGAESVGSDKVQVFDSGGCSASNLILVQELLKLINNNASMEEVLKRAEEVRKNAVIQFAPITMEYLKRGGRIGLLSATFATLLNIKPILYFRNGVLKCVKKCLGLGKTMQEQLEIAGKKIKNLYVCYVHESELLEKFMKKVKDFFGVETIKTSKIGPVVGSHVGIGAFGLAYLIEE